MRIVETADDSLTLSAAVNFTNPTNYTAEIPYADVNILVNGTVIGHATVKNVGVVRGHNANVPVQAVWEPSRKNGTLGRLIGREFLSQYVSGMITF